MGTKVKRTTKQVKNRNDKIRYGINKIQLRTIYSYIKNLRKSGTRVKDIIIK